MSAPQVKETLSPARFDDLEMGVGVTFDIWLGIQNTKARYFRLIDTKQWELFGMTFTSDGVLEVPERGHSVTTRAEIVKSVSASLDSAISLHHGHMGEIALVDERHADVIWAMEDVVIWDGLADGSGTTRVLHGYGHYFERYRLEEGVWRIAHCRLVRLHTETTDVRHFRDPMHRSPGSVGWI